MNPQAPCGYEVPLVRSYAGSTLATPYGRVLRLLGVPKTYSDATQDPQPTRRSQGGRLD